MVEQARTILGQVRDQYGITFTEAMTGGGCMALESRLESGHWIVATDEMLLAFSERVQLEVGHAPLGWFVGIYPDNGDDGWFGVDSIIEATDYDARAEQLPDMIGKALTMLANNR